MKLFIRELGERLQMGLGLTVQLKQLVVCDEMLALDRRVLSRLETTLSKHRLHLIDLRQYKIRFR
ncbi:hypothetical protein D3C76_1422010 [compost metagenome]